MKIFAKPFWLFVVSKKNWSPLMKTYPRAKHYYYNCTSPPVFLFPFRTLQTQKSYRVATIFTRAELRTQNYRKKYMFIWFIWDFQSDYMYKIHLYLQSEYSRFTLHSNLIIPWAWNSKFLGLQFSMTNILQ